MRYRFTKNGDERLYEKNVDANVSSEQQRNDIIKKYEKEIELPTTEK